MIGTQLGKWVIDKPLGRGGMGRVYLAHDPADGQLAAVKVLAAELAQESGFLQRFQREIEVLDQLKHPNVVRLLGSGCQDGLFYFAMEYVEGPNFEQLLLQQGRLPWKEVLDAALQICPALKHAHDRGIIHRDIKPPNLLRNADGVVKLTDFGIAKVFAARHLTNTGGVVGTAEYLSPEQAQGKPATKRSDLYSLGVVLYTLVTGRPPFQGHETTELLHKHVYSQFDRPGKIVPGLPLEMDEVICQLMEKDPSRRPGDAMVLQRQLESIRRKLERKAQATMHDISGQPTRADHRLAQEGSDREGPATLMGRLMRDELDRQKYGGGLRQWFNRPVVVVPLFLLCVGLIVWGWRSKPTAETLFRKGEALMQSDKPDDWQAAWEKYFEPLERDFTDHPYRDQVAAYRRQIREAEDDKTLDRAIHSGLGRAAASEAERFYRRGLRLCQDGDWPEAERIWQNLVCVFASIPAEERWVTLSHRGLKELQDKRPVVLDRERAIQAALESARNLRQEGKAREADELLKSLRVLYGVDAVPPKTPEKASGGQE
jgi:serine/threonine-protein kinase